MTTPSVLFGDRVHYEIAPQPYRRPHFCAVCGSEVPDDGQLVCGPIELKGGDLFVDGQRILLASKLGGRISRKRASLKLLAVLIRASDRVITKRMALAAISDSPGDVDDKYVEVIISHIRKAIHPYRDMIQTIYGVGYKLVPALEEAKRR